MFSDVTIKQFLDQVASSEPVPGGGSVSALAAALSAALVTMVAKLTVGNKNYEVVRPAMESIIAQIGPRAVLLAQMADTDAMAFQAVMSAYKLPKATEEEKAARKSAIQEALKNAALVPLQVAQAGAELLPALEMILKQGNPNAVTDAAVAVLLMRAAVFGALYNVRINLAAISDQNFVNELRAAATELESIVKEAESKLLAIAETKIYSGV